ncbi:hypothetical protein BS47DRAFT_1337829 [Hydnum rufescens UP504]|uniref:Uncharacterized protein n=1 Tax=Hydnum rufescens UP504 TaxID=1448309 RepID=A0A9P6DXX6_9AGAM|nr:hypothetical protein BS47DRAFT_1337829 [Hydnum rufescens UP504]
MATAFANSIPPGVMEWLDPKLLPVYGVTGVALFFLGRYIDNTFVRPPSKTGFGKGAPGFITNTRQIKVTPEIAARLRRGEQVSPEEIDVAVKAAEAALSGAAPSAVEVSPTKPSPKKTKVVKRKVSSRQPAPVKVEDPKEAVNEWIPEGHIKKGSQRRRQR